MITNIVCITLIHDSHLMATETVGTKVCFHAKRFCDSKILHQVIILQGIFFLSCHSVNDSDIISE